MVISLSAKSIRWNLQQDQWLHPVSALVCLTLPCLISTLSQLYPVSTLSHSQPYCLNSTLSQLCSFSTLPCPYSLSALLSQLYSVLSQLYPVSTMFKFYSLSLSPTASTLLCLNSALSQPLSHYPSIPNCKIRTNNRNVIITPSWEQATYIYICTKDWHSVMHLPSIIKRNWNNT